MSVSPITTNYQSESNHLIFEAFPRQTNSNWSLVGLILTRCYTLFSFFMPEAKQVFFIIEIAYSQYRCWCYEEYKDTAQNIIFFQ